MVFSTKDRERCLAPEIRPRIWSYLGGIGRENNIDILVVGGYEDHCHLLISLPSTLSIAQTVRLLKGSSSRWISQAFPQLQFFLWQPGYGAFGIGISQIKKTIEYINNQEEHHKHQSFKDEYVGFLNHHHIAFDKESIWTESDGNKTISSEGQNDL